ncbi:MAG TPA: hypothetical protein VIX73_08175 [Kofleriaceae bacterium]|jgi:hypothetical protein
MSLRFAALAAVVVAGGMTACGSDATSFRPTDRSDPNHAGPPSAMYDVYLAGQLVARTHVWSSGGYISSSDEPMTHIGFEVSSATLRPLAFDADALELVGFDSDGATLPPIRLTSITPRAAALIPVPAASTIVLGAYFLLPVRPRNVATMQVRWTLRTDSEEYRQVTALVRDDDAPLNDYTPPSAVRFPSS